MSLLDRFSEEPPHRHYPPEIEETVAALRLCLYRGYDWRRLAINRLLTILQYWGDHPFELPDDISTLLSEEIAPQLIEDLRPPDDATLPDRTAAR